MPLSVLELHKRRESKLTKIDDNSIVGIETSVNVPIINL